jgi:hypothetical protein
MDEENRERGQLTIENARRLGRRHAARDEIIAEYLQGISFYLQILNKSTADFYALSDAYYDTATLYFNTANYAKAGENYLASINQVLHSQLNDDGYRKLTELYIDLADACYELFNQKAGDDAMANAIKAFGLIKIKTSKEQEIGDPITNFKQFHAYYEKKLSTDSYLSSSKFANHEQLFGEGQSTRQQEQALFEQFEGISICDLKKIDDSLEHMLSQLSVSAEQQFFSPIPIGQSPGDGAYRNMAMQILRLAQSHVQNKLIPNAVATYRQAIDTLKAIKEPKESDKQIIENLQAQIEFLNKKPKPQESHVSSTLPGANHHHHQRTQSVVSAAAFFGQPQQARYPHPGEDFSDKMDVSSDAGMYM